MSQSRNMMYARSVFAMTLSVGVLTSASSAFAASHRAHAPLSSLHGTVVFDNLARHTVVVALHTGKVRTIRFSSAQHVAVGTMISARVSTLGDGTVRATSFSRHATTHAVRLQGTIVGTHGRQLELSSGGSVILVSRPLRHAHDSSTNVQVGEVVTIDASVQGGSLDETSLQDMGTSNLIQLEGVLTDLSTTSMTIAVSEGVPTVVAIPLSITVPSTIAVGDQVEVMAAYANQSFTLVSVGDDQAAANSSNGVNESDQGQSSNLQIEGIVVAVNAASLTIQPGDNAAALLLVIPTSLTLGTVAVGDQVHVVADMVAGVLTVTSVEVQAPDGNQGDAITTEVEGQVISVSPTSLVVQPSDGGSPVTFVVATSTDVSTIVVGNRIQAAGVLSAGILTLTTFELA